MHLAPNTKFDHYEILAPLGKGGMGEVYRARDIRLNRDVAIKVLPSEIAHDADRLRRFEQEARTTSALNHPNILTVYDFGNYEGNAYLVMELLEGEELRTQLDPGPPTPRGAIHYAQQIAAGLAAAHEKGIVHRDLKPENLFITKDGRVKILDFGLAKLRPPRPISAGSDVETQKQLTSPGTVLGTVSYMSPEQVRGQELDHRSDIFSLGIILHEMLSGQRPFRGEQMADVMSAILKEDPPELSESNAKISPALEKIVRRCLEKKPERRFQSASDLSFALEALSSPGSAGGSPASGVQVIAAKAGEPLALPGRWRERIAWLVAGASVLTALALGLAYFWHPTVEVTTMRLAVTPPEGAAMFEHPTISPDGRTLAFVARTTGVRQIWVRALELQSARPLAGTEGVDQMFWSPDSQWLAFVSGVKLRKIALTGGAPVTLCDTSSLSSGAWNRDGVILFSDGINGIKRIAANGGTVTGVTTVNVAHGETAHYAPFFLPDSRHFLFYIQHSEPAKRGIYLRALDGGEAKLILTTEVRTFWAGVNPAAPSEGWLVFMRQGALLAQSFDFSRGQVGGDPLRIAEQVQTSSIEGYFSLSDNGVLVFSEGMAKQQLLLVDRSGQKLRTVGPPGQYGSPVFSPDEQRVAVGQRGPQNQSPDIHLLDLASGRDTRFTFDEADDTVPVWSPDGSGIVWASRRTGMRNLYRKAANSAGEDELLWKSAFHELPQDWSKDGRFILYQEFTPQTSSDLWILPLTGDRKPWPWLKTEFAEVSARFSPDGKWIAYATNAPGRFEVYVRAFNPDASAASGQWQVSTNGGLRPLWRRDGRELYYFSADEKLMAVDITLGAEVKADTPRVLFNLHDLHTIYDGGYAATGNGQRFLFVTNAEDAALTPFTVVTNWMAELKR